MKRLSRLGVLLIVVLPLVYSLGLAVGHAAESGNFASPAYVQLCSPKPSVTSSIALLIISV